MACRIAENQPLIQLRKDIGLAPQCHSSRGHCKQSYRRVSEGKGIMGGPGTAIGYCQGLFSKQGSPKHHTQYLVKQFESANLPWGKSHELYWNYREDETVSEYIEEAIEPLLGEGRVPILITSLDPANDLAVINEILRTQPRVVPGETILVRLSLNSRDSLEPVAEIINSIVVDSKKHARMPVWWPLLQGSISLEYWDILRQMLGDNWDYVNIAMNPFTPEDVVRAYSNNITVAQFVLGASHGVHSDGSITILREVDLGFTQAIGAYNLFAYARRIKDLHLMPMSIICGPALSEWTEKENQERLSKIMDLYAKATRDLWADANAEGRSEILSLQA